MDNINQNLSKPYTILSDRILFYDGDSVVTPDKLENLILSGNDMRNIKTTKITNEIKQYNLNTIDKIQLKTEIKDLDYSWNIPENYQNMDVLQYVIEKFINKYTKIDNDRYNRMIFEMKQFKRIGLYDFLRTLIYVQEVIENNNIVKGVGRGSSVSSYVLYLIGIHKIDSYKYNLDFEEFIKE